ncbi:MAG: hypothetical protein E7231_13295 [Cellulosilyticum sp.]|nr:hypothetical protein [Cellulosilyticum sp.]
MNKKLWSALGLSLIIGSQSLYAENLSVINNIETTSLVNIDDQAQFEIIDNNIIQDQSVANETGETGDKQLEQNLTGLENQVNENGVETSEGQENTDSLGDTPIVGDQLNGNESEDMLNPEQGNTDSTQNLDLINKVILTLDSKVAIVDGIEEELISAPTVINDTTLLPMRFVGDKVVGAQVDWNAETKTVTMSKDGTVVSVTIGSKIALINGLEVELQVEPTVKDNVTLVPLRFLSEALNVQVDYNSDTKTITLHKGSKPVIQNQAPIPSFYFPENYIAGQVVSVINESYDPDGDTIKDHLWCVVGEKTVTNKELSNMFKTPRAGTYTIGLKVQDSKGTWSDWSYQTVTILPNQAPVITSLEPVKSSFAQGEPIEFLPYTYENESWETVTEGKWTYRKLEEAENRATLGKPNMIFTEGDYVVTLYLDDAYGNRSVGYQTTVHISNEVRDTELNYKFSTGLIGEWIDNFEGTNYLTYKQAEVLGLSYRNGTLIMSDSPEDVKGQGILYRDSINGIGRILIHHINKVESTEKQRLALVVENPTDQPITVTLKNKAIKGPATDILRVGQMSLYDYLSGTIAPETIILQPKEKKYIYDKTWGNNTCISGHMDVETTGEAKFTVANLGVSHTLENLDSLYYYPADGVHYSGTYDKVGINYNLSLDGTQAERLTLGVVNSGEWAVGYDERTQLPVENTGNFGISYYITVTAQEDMGVILNNRGGIFQGAVKWNDTVYNMPGKGIFSGTTTKAVVLGTIKKGETVTIEYLLPNGSAAPTLLGFIPKSQW